MTRPGAPGPRNLKWPAVAGVVRGRIGDGTLGPGARPSIGRLAPELGVRKRTAGRALEAEGLPERRPGTGYVVLPPPGGG